MNIFKKCFTITLFIGMTLIVQSQITAPLSSTSFSTNYTSGFMNNGGENDVVYVFCSDQDNSNVGELHVSAGGCTVNWYKYDGLTYSDLGITNNTASALSSGLYMAQVDCSGTVSCYRAWVWVNQTYINVSPIDPGCETFTLTGEANVLDNTFLINDPPGVNFEIDENTFIKVCFWANHTCVSDLGFYLKAPGQQLTEPGNDGVVSLLPAAADWGIDGEFQSNTTIPWSVTGCDLGDINTSCNQGNHIEEFCFSTHYYVDGPALTPGDPEDVPCICDMAVPLAGAYAPAESWENIYGYMAGDPGWAVQIYDCEEIDFGALTMASLVFRSETDCGQTTFVYDSGEIYSTISDNSCDASSASVYVVPPEEPAGEYTITSEITDYSWSCTGSGFTGDQLSHQITQNTSDFPQQTSDFILSVTETINVTGTPQCETIASETFVTLPSNAEITPVEDVCTNSSPIQLEAVDAGGIWSTNAPAGSIVNNTFFPDIAGEGTWNIDYEINGPCPDQDQITITVYENIHIENFSDNICNGTNTHYTVHFDVVNGSGSATTYNVNYGSGTSQLSSAFDVQFESQSNYSITITDLNGCSEIILEGSTDCGCDTYAGNMTSTVPINLCANECTDAIIHDGLQNLDTDDTFEFAIHDGNYPANIYARKNTPEFCFSDLPSGNYGTTYFVSAICGNNLVGHVDQDDPCYSQSIGVPVTWFENPIAFISEENINICGLTVELEADAPNSGMTGTWTSSGTLIPSGGSTINDNVIEVVSNTFGAVTYIWTVNNGVCSGSDQVVVNFYEKPTAYAGNDTTLCGNEVQLGAIYSLPGTTGTWSGTGTFDNSGSPTSSVTSSAYGSQVYTWTEIHGSCIDQDYTTINFIQEPTPTTTPNTDSVCGNEYTLSVYNVNGTGKWTAYHEGSPIAPLFSPLNTDPNATVTIGSFPGNSYEVVFVWVETNLDQGVECTGSASKTVVFARVPSAGVGDDDFPEICGDCITFNANTTGSEWADGSWIAKDILGSWDDPTLPNATFCINPNGSYGDTARVERLFLWSMRNPDYTGCVSMDTVIATFYQQPSANAGLDDIVCGKDYDLSATYSLPATTGYTPNGWWETYTKPDGSNVNIENDQENDTHVTVSHNGLYEFVFRENNENRTSCFDTDTVLIEFVEKPIINAGDDTDVCGQETTLNANTGGNNGTWSIGPANIDDPTDPHSPTQYSNYGDVIYEWIEYNFSIDSSLSCVSRDTVVITYWKIPTAVISTDLADSTACGYNFENLSADNPGSDISGFWYSENPGTQFYSSEYDRLLDSVIVPSYGYHDFYWIEESGTSVGTGFCNDTAGPFTVHFIENPISNAGNDTLFCGYSGYLSAVASVGTGVWTTPSTDNITFEDENDPNTFITSDIINTGNPIDPYFTITWTEDNTNECTDNASIQVIFARIPDSDLEIIPPKCFGEPASIRALEDSLQQYDWNFYDGVIDTTFFNEANGAKQNFVFWNSEDTSHNVSLIATNHWGCQSSITIDTVFEPSIPSFDVTIISDTCMLNRGGLIFSDTTGDNAFFWIEPGFEDYNVGDPITEVYGLPSGEYSIESNYQTRNTDYVGFYLTHFDTDKCIDTVLFEIEPIGMIEAFIEIDEVSTDMTALVAPSAQVFFTNNSIYDDVSKRCVWYFGDGESENNCDLQVTHTYTEADCYLPYLVVMNRDLQECRDTAFIETCIKIDDASEIEIPNIFSPNGDGVNDFFQVKASTLNTFSGIIVNRWGRTVYEWTNWEDYVAGWDGKLSGGTDASPGVYYYVIKAVGMDGLEYDEHGPLHLMRD